MVRLMTGDTGHYACRSDAFSTLSTQRADGQRFHSPVLVGIVLVLLRVLDLVGEVRHLQIVSRNFTLQTKIISSKI